MVKEDSVIKKKKKQCVVHIFYVTRACQQVAVIFVVSMIDNTNAIRDMHMSVVFNQTSGKIFSAVG